MSLLAVTVGKNKPRKKSVLGIDLGVIAIDIGVYGEHKAPNNTDNHSEIQVTEGVPATDVHIHTEDHKHEISKDISTDTNEHTDHPEDANNLAPAVAIFDQWKCRLHHSDAHEIFINYRVSTDGDLAEKLADQIHLHKKSNSGQTRVFLDKKCLPVGENWQVSFLNGLMKSDVIVLLMSSAGIENIKNAHNKQDNVLLEYEYALQRLEEEGPEKVKVIPVLVGRKIKVPIDGQEVEVFQKFQFPNMNDFPDAPHNIAQTCHISKKTNQSVREVMRHIFGLQGIFLNDVSNLTGLITELTDVLQK